MVLRPLLKAERVGVDERWVGSDEFQIFGATYENDLVAITMEVLHKGTLRPIY